MRLDLQFDYGISRSEERNRNGSCLEAWKAHVDPTDRGLDSGRAFGLLVRPRAYEQIQRMTSHGRNFQNCKREFARGVQRALVQWSAVDKCSLLRCGKHGGVRRVLLIVLLIIAAAIAFSQADWVFQRMQDGMGAEVAEATVSFDVVLTLVLVMAGFAVGYAVDRFIRHRKAFFCSGERAWWAQWFLRIWGYELQYEAEFAPASLAVSETPAEGEPSPTPIPPPRRRGRKPTFTLEYWLPIAVQWENRDTTRDAFTLAELIAAHLGTNADGSPVVTEQAYYTTWRDRALKELQRRARAGKPKAGPETRQKA